MPDDSQTHISIQLDPKMQEGEVELENSTSVTSYPAQKHVILKCIGGLLQNKLVIPVLGVLLIATFIISVVALARSSETGSTPPSGTGSTPPSETRPMPPSETRPAPPSETMPTPLPSLLPEETSAPMPGCTVISRGNCYSGGHGNIIGTPRFSTCRTNPVPLENHPFCRVTPDQEMVTSATLVKTSPGMLSCKCDVLEFPNFLQSTIAPFNCEILKRHCP